MAGVVTTISAMLLHHAPSRFRTHAKIDITPHIKNVNTFTYAQLIGGLLLGLFVLIGYHSELL